ncbi:hypothetical protein FH972_015210 [Carpinus fangiana]|uniref:Uncharacterized protein n=1 Tax=Carpinus fangiana TaxID=176857 RepID=A0A5N6RFH8_9ROSI|nr:hypothetical protein FH972_015210 [Carpinus fangiana]
MRITWEGVKVVSLWKLPSVSSKYTLLLVPVIWLENNSALDIAGYFILIGQCQSKGTGWAKALVVVGDRSLPNGEQLRVGVQWQEVAGSSSTVSGSLMVFNEQSCHLEVYGSSSIVTGSQLVSLTSSVDDDDGSIRSVDDGLIGSDFSDDGSIGSVGACGVVHAMLELAMGLVLRWWDAVAMKLLDDSARKDTQAWFYRWLRAGVQHDESPLAKLEVIVENTSRANLAVSSPDRSLELLQMWEELASLDAERRQDMATAWVQALLG